MDINRIKSMVREHGEMLISLADRLSVKGQKLEEHEAKAIRRVVVVRAEEEFEFLTSRYVRDGEIDQALLKDLFPYITSNM